MIRLLACFSIAALTCFGPALAEKPADSPEHLQSLDRLEGDYLYRVTTTRAAPGRLEELLEWFTAVKNSDYYQKAGEPAPFLLRHSQGDQWDLMLFTPMDSMQEFYKKRRVERRDHAAGILPTVSADPSDLISFSEDLYALGPDISDFEREVEGKGLFHVEMFHALAGKHGELYRQRRMENGYLAATGQRANMIFSVEAGGDVDVFTIGAHESFVTFAAPAPASDDEKEVEARAAGFKDRADITFYLRSLISGHHDTLAVSVE